MKNIIFFLIIVLASCEKQRYGNVIERWHEPAQTCIKIIPISTGKAVIMAPYKVHDNEDWCIKVASVRAKGDTLVKMYYVTAEAYDTLTIGKFICTDGASREDTNNTKTRQ